MPPRKPLHRVTIEPRYHPSGMPVRFPKVGKIASIWRIPSEGALTPRLRFPPPMDAIGFQYVRPDPVSDDED